MYCDECGQDKEDHMAYCKSQELNDQWKGGSTNIRPSYYAKYKIDPWTFII